MSFLCDSCDYNCENQIIITIHKFEFAINSNAQKKHTSCQMHHWQRTSEKIDGGKSFRTDSPYSDRRQMGLRIRWNFRLAWKRCNCIIFSTRKYYLIVETKFCLITLSISNLLLLKKFSPKSIYDHLRKKKVDIEICRFAKAGSRMVSPDTRKSSTSSLSAAILTVMKLLCNDEFRDKLPPNLRQILRKIKNWMKVNGRGFGFDLENSWKNFSGHDCDKRGISPHWVRGIIILFFNYQKTYCMKGFTKYVVMKLKMIVSSHQSDWLYVRKVDKILLKNHLIIFLICSKMKKRSFLKFGNFLENSNFF